MFNLRTNAAASNNAGAIWFEHKIVLALSLLRCILMIVNVLVHASHWQSGVSTTNYGKLCKVTDVSAPVLSIMTNVSVMLLVMWKAWLVSPIICVWSRCSCLWWSLGCCTS